MDADIYGNGQGGGEMTSRQFTGVWVPAFVYESKDLCWNAKMIFLEIHSFTANGMSCYLGNDHFCNRLGITDRRVRGNIESLIDMGWIEKTIIDGKRHLKSLMFEGAGHKRPEGRTQTSGGADTNVRLNNKYNSKENNKEEINKESSDAHPSDSLYVFSDDSDILPDNYDEETLSQAPKEKKGDSEQQMAKVKMAAPSALEFYDSFVEAHGKYGGRKRGPKPEWENLVKRQKIITSELISDISKGIDKEAAWREWTKLKGGFLPSYKNLATWINNQCWTTIYEPEFETGYSKGLTAKMMTKKMVY